MLKCWSIEAGQQILGGTSITYLFAAIDISLVGWPATKATGDRHASVLRMSPSTHGRMHLHPAYQQHELALFDGLHVLETTFVPRTGLDVPAVVQLVIALDNCSPRPLRFYALASLDLRGSTTPDVVAQRDQARGALVAHNASRPEWARVLGGLPDPSAYMATADEVRTFEPWEPFDDQIDSIPGDLTGALRFRVELDTGQHRHIRVVIAFSPHGKDAALAAYDAARHDRNALQKTIAYFAEAINTAVIEVPDNLLNQGVQWAKANLLRPVHHFPVAQCDGSSDVQHRSRPI